MYVLCAGYVQGEYSNNMSKSERRQKVGAKRIQVRQYDVRVCTGMGAVQEDVEETLTPLGC